MLVTWLCSNATLDRYKSLVPNRIDYSLKKIKIKNSEWPFLPFPHLIHFFPSFVTSENIDGQHLQSQPSTWHCWWAQFERLVSYILTTSSSFMTGNKPSKCLCSFPTDVTRRVISDKLWEMFAIYTNFWRLPGNVQTAVSQNARFYELWKMYSHSQKSFSGDMGELLCLKSEAQTSDKTAQTTSLRCLKLISHLFSREQGKFAFERNNSGLKIPWSTFAILDEWEDEQKIIMGYYHIRLRKGTKKEHFVTDFWKINKSEWINRREGEVHIGPEFLTRALR